jgi:hypothetical protein
LNKALSEEIQKHLDEFLEYYNVRRSHQGYRLRQSTTNPLDIWIS